MNLKNIIACLSTCLMTTTATIANAQVDPSQIPLFTLVQRHCTGGDVVIENNSPSQTVTTDCKWQQTRKDDKGNLVKDKNGKDIQEDTDMQITLQLANDVQMVAMHCTFTPATTQSGTIDQIADIAVSKAARSNASSYPRQLLRENWWTSVDTASGKTDIQAIIYNYKNDHDKDNLTHSHANVVFDLNQARSERSWLWNSAPPFNENNTLRCTFAPNYIPPLPAENS